MKKIVSVVLAVIMLASFSIFFVSAADYAYDGQVDCVIDGIGYDLSTAGGKRTARIIDASAATGDVILPEAIELDGESYQPVAVVSGAFTGCEGLKSVTLPKYDNFTFIDSEGSASITDGVFVNCGDDAIKIYYYKKQLPIGAYTTGTSDNVVGYPVDIDPDITEDIFGTITRLVRKLLDWIKSLFDSIKTGELPTIGK